MTIWISKWADTCSLISVNIHLVIISVSVNIQDLHEIVNAVFVWVLSIGPLLIVAWPKRWQLLLLLSRQLLFNESKFQNASNFAICDFDVAIFCKILVQEVVQGCLGLLESNESRLAVVTGVRTVLFE